MFGNGGQGPTIGGFQAFITNVMRVPPSALDPTAPVVTYAYDFALQWVTEQLCLVPGIQGSWNMYAIAIYNLAADTLVNWVQDDPAAPLIPGTDPPVRYWQWLRDQFQVYDFVAGVVQSTSDQGTSASYMIPETFNGYTIGNLQNLKTPWGRQYLAIASSLGTLWGLS